MRIKIIFSLIIILTLFGRCSNTGNNGSNHIIIEERLAIPKTKSEELINKIRPESQKFQIIADSDNILTGKNGTQVFVPKNSFVNKDGELITGKVDIELIEVLSAADFIKTNLQTVSNGKPLQSQGMFFIDAKSKGESVAIANDKKLQIELPNLNNSEAASAIKIFSGTYDSTGNINWNETGKIENKLIPLPLDLFEYKSWTSFGFERVPNNNGYSAAGNDEIVDSTTFKQKKLENTFIATREFEKRFYPIISAEWEIGTYTSYYSTTIPKGKMIKDSTISKIYLNNLDKDLWYCDSLAYSYMKSWEGKINFNTYWYSEITKTDLLAMFKKFYEERLTKVVQFPDIDLSSKDARDKLEKKGFKPTEIDEILGAYEMQKKIVTARRDMTTATRIVTNSFAISKLGWINCDQFYNDPTAKEVNILASVTNMENYEFASLSLVINGRKIALNGTLGDDSKYSFTGKSQPYTRLPIGEKATIIGISYKNGKPYLGIKEIVISEKASYDIELVESSIQDINEKLKGLN